MDAKQLHDLGQQLRVDSVHAAGIGAKAIEAAARTLAGDKLALR